MGQGSFGVTYKAKTKIRIEGSLGTIDSNVYVAVKEFFMKEINGREGSKVTNGNKEGLFTDYRKKFLREADNLSKLKHPHIINVLETFEANGTVYYSMEYIDGGSLDDLILNNHRLSETETIEYAKQIASALGYMHKHHVLHLDVKPSNIMLRQDSGKASYSVVLIDFGLSKQYDEKGVPESSTTVGGGTPGYAPIEQSSYHEGKDFPVTMDVYALGATMYKMLVGRCPSVASVILNEGFPMACLLKHNVSNAMASIIKKAMMPRKDERFQSVFDLRNELENLNAYQDEESEETHIDENNLFKEPKDNAEKEEEINVSQNEESEETYVEEHLVIDRTVDKIVIKYNSNSMVTITPHEVIVNPDKRYAICVDNYKSFLAELAKLKITNRKEAPHDVNVAPNTEKVSITTFKNNFSDRIYTVQTCNSVSYGCIGGDAKSVWDFLKSKIKECLVNAPLFSPLKKKGESEKNKLEDIEDIIDGILIFGSIAIVCVPVYILFVLKDWTRLNADTIETVFRFVLWYPLGTGFITFIHFFITLGSISRIENRLIRWCILILYIIIVILIEIYAYTFNINDYEWCIKHILSL